MAEDLAGEYEVFEGWGRRRIEEEEEAEQSSRGGALFWRGCEHIHEVERLLIFEIEGQTAGYLGSECEPFEGWGRMSPEEEAGRRRRYCLARLRAHPKVHLT